MGKMSHDFEEYVQQHPGKPEQDKRAKPKGMSFNPPPMVTVGYGVVEYEIRLCSYRTMSDPHKYERWLTEQGKEGWQLCSTSPTRIYPDGSEGSIYCTHVFSRKKGLMRHVEKQAG